MQKACKAAWVGSTRETFHMARGTVAHINWPEYLDMGQECQAAGSWWTEKPVAEAVWGLPGA